jgi:hypothetical protein
MEGEGRKVRLGKRLKSRRQRRRTCGVINKRCKEFQEERNANLEKKEMDEMNGRR